jgi:hypothetical protein
VESDPHWRIAFTPSRPNRRYIFSFVEIATTAAPTVTGAGA